MATTRSARNQKAYRDRIRAGVQQYVDQLMDDVTVSDVVRGGKRYINVDSSKATWEALEAIAALNGTTMDDMIKDYIANQLKLFGKWKLLQDRREKP